MRMMITIMMMVMMMMTMVITPTASLATSPKRGKESDEPHCGHIQRHSRANHIGGIRFCIATFGLSEADIHSGSTDTYPAVTQRVVRVRERQCSPRIIFGSRSLASQQPACLGAMSG